MSSDLFLHTILEAYFRIFKKSPVLFLLTVLMYITVLAFAIKIDFLASPEKKLEAHKQKFYETASKIIQVKDGAKLDFDPLVNLYNSIDRESGGRLKEYGYNNLLEDYMLHTLKTKDGNESKAVSEKINQLLEEERQKRPYDVLTEGSKRAINNLKQSIETKNYEQAALNFNSLEQDFVETYRGLKNLEIENEFNKKLGIIGLTLTIIFGLLGIIWPLLLRKKIIE